MSREWVALGLPWNPPWSAALLLGALVACGNHATDPAKEIPVCEDFLRQSRACIARLDPKRADEVTASTRRVLYAGAKDEASRANVSATCAKNLTLLSASCPSSGLRAETK